MTRNIPGFELVSGSIESITGFKRRIRTTIDSEYPHLQITIPAGTIFDGKSIGRMTYTEKSLRAFLLHDWLYQNADRNKFSRREVDSIVRKICPEETEILDRWYAQPILFVAWKLRIGGFHSLFD